MALPLSFLSGLFLLLLHGELDESLPGEESAARLLAASAVLVLPWLLARLSAVRLERAVRDGVRSVRAIHVAVRAPAIAVPFAYGVLLFGGGLPALVERWAPDLHLAKLGLLLGPLLALEVSVRWAERESASWIDRLRLAGMPVLGIERLPMVFLVMAPFAALAVVADLVSMDRRAEVFFHETSLGIGLGLLLLVGALCVALPLTFRAVMPVSRDLPPGIARDLRRTAAALGFPGDGVLSMRTGHRLVNAALVGLAPWPRFLVLTDGLLALLDPLSLRGVVAHEVGHARAQHPGLLVLVFAVLPLLLFFPASLVDISHLDRAWLFAGLGAAAVAGGAALRVLAHRFEYEADQLSAEALGGASYCAQALHRVGQLSPQTLHRSSFRHPSERRRIRHLQACEQDPGYRARFWRRGRWLRLAIAGGLATALGLCLWAQLALWPVDRAAFLFYCGRLPEARAQLASLPADLPEPQRAFAERLASQVEAGLELGLRRSEWSAVRDDLAPRAGARAEQMLIAGGAPADAVPWLSLALYQARPEPWLQSLYLYCRAVQEEEEELGERVRRHLLDLDTPPPIKHALRRL